MSRPNCNKAEAESRVIYNTVLLKKGKKKVCEENVNDVLGLFTPAKELVQGEVSGRKEGWAIWRVLQMRAQRLLTVTTGS